MAESPVLGKPGNVAPFIRFARWSLLAVGVLYGITRHNYLQKKENEHRAYIAKMTPIWTAQRNATKEEMNKREMAALKEQTGVQL